jgi:hypothetical protein
MRDFAAVVPTAILEHFQIRSLNNTIYASMKTELSIDDFETTYIASKQMSGIPNVIARVIKADSRLIFLTAQTFAWSEVRKTGKSGVMP